MSFEYILVGNINFAKLFRLEDSRVDTSVIIHRETQKKKQYSDKKIFHGKEEACATCLLEATSSATLERARQTN